MNGPTSIQFEFHRHWQQCFGDQPRILACAENRARRHISGLQIQCAHNQLTQNGFFVESYFQSLVHKGLRMRAQASLSLLPDVPPTASELLSALVKTIRLRMTAEALSYLSMLWRTTETRRRAQRRILIGAAEDNLDIAVMQAVAAWFNGRERGDFTQAALQVCRITATPNWYATPGGRAYIRSWRAAEISANPYRGRPQGQLERVMQEAVRTRSLPNALQAFHALYERRDMQPRAFADFLLRVATETDNRPALEVAEIYADNLSDLWRDGNYSGIALYTLLEGPVGPQGSAILHKNNTLQLIAKINSEAGRPVSIPSWCLDGIHTRGNDARFAGTLKHMAAACDAFERHGRLHPDD